MKTTITQNEAGLPVLAIEGIEAPESIAREYLKIQGMLSPPKEEEKKVIEPILKKEVTKE